MKYRIDLRVLLSHTSDGNERLTSFALFCLGMIESLTSGAIGASGAVEMFFHADNCQFVRKELRQKDADKIMSHGVQLGDLFDILPVEDAQREFQRELATMHALCLELLEADRIAA